MLFHYRVGLGRAPIIGALGLGNWKKWIFGWGVLNILEKACNNKCVVK